MKNKSEQFTYEMTALVAQVGNLTDILTRMSQSLPSVSGKASAFVALAKDPRLDGRVGAGDVVVSVLLAGGGLSIGAIGATGIFFGGVDILSTGEIFSIGTLTGCGLGLLRMAIDALAIPLMLSNLMEWGADRWNEWLDHRAELIASGLPKVIERPVVLYPIGADPKPWESYTTDYANYSITIREETEHAKAIDWTYGRLWYFIEDCHRTGEWSRAKVCSRWGSDEISQSEHKAVSDFLKSKAPGLWGLTGKATRPTLEAHLKRFRWTPNQPTSQPTNQPGENYE